MGYVYQISFDFAGKDYDQMRLGESVQVALAYMKALLPNEPGFITSRAMYSLNHTELTHVVFESLWEDWDSLMLHRSKSVLNESQLLKEFKLGVEAGNLQTHIFEETE